MASTIENLKGFVTFLREGIIVLVLLMFLLLPGVMNNVLGRAGFTKASVAGFEWELQDSVQKTQDATKTVGQLEQRLQDLSKRLDQISQSANTPPAVKEQITSLSQQVDQTRSETNSVQNTLKSSVAVQQRIIERVNPAALSPVTRAPQR